MVRSITCPKYGVVMSNCFGKTGKTHKIGCPFNQYRRL